MKIFNLENAPKGIPASKVECIVIGTWEEWQIVCTALDAHAMAHPRMKKLQTIKTTFDDHLTVF